MMFSQDTGDGKEISTCLSQGGLLLATRQTTVRPELQGNPSSGTSKWASVNSFPLPGACFLQTKGLGIKLEKSLKYGERELALAGLWGASLNPLRGPVEQENTQFHLISSQSTVTWSQFPTGPLNPAITTSRGTTRWGFHWERFQLGQMESRFQGIYYEINVTHIQIASSASPQQLSEHRTSDAGIASERQEAAELPPIAGSAGQEHQAAWAKPPEPAHGSAPLWPGQRQQNFATLLPLRTQYRNAADGDAIAPGPRPYRLLQMSPSGAMASEHWKVTAQKWRLTPRPWLLNIYHYCLGSRDVCLSLLEEMLCIQATKELIITKHRTETTKQKCDLEGIFSPIGRSSSQAAVHQVPASTARASPVCHVGLTEKNHWGKLAREISALCKTLTDLFSKIREKRKHFFCRATAGVLLTEQFSWQFLAFLSGAQGTLLFSNHCLGVRTVTKENNASHT